MPDKLSKPDLSLVGRKSKAYIPPLQEVDLLSKKYGFSDTEKLHAKISQELKFYDRSLVNFPSSKLKRESLKLFQKCSGLVESELKLDSSAYYRMAELYGDGFDDFMERITQDVSVIKALSLKALHDWEVEKDKKPKKPIWNLVWNLADIWWAEKGEIPTCSHNVFKEDNYSGEFYNFVSDCEKLGKIKLSSGYTGSTIEKILIEWRKEKT